MNDGGTSTANRDLRTLFEAGATGALTDGQLLDRFVSAREEAVFEAIVRRHGPMVWNVCRRVLQDHHEAEDAFQATFLVLARKAASVAPREKLGNWLYGVAYQTAVKARAAAAKRRSREKQVPELPEPEQRPADQTTDWLALLDQELRRLPEKYRVPIVLCELEGRSHRQAAEGLGWPIGTVSGRLSRAKAILAQRLARRGVTLPTASLALLLVHDAVSAGMPVPLIGSTARAGSRVAAGQALTAGMVSAEVVALTREVLKTMLLTKLKIGVTVLVLVLVTGGGTLWMAARPTAAQEHGPAKPVTPAAAPAATDAERLQGVWTGVVAEFCGRRASHSENLPLPEAKIRVRGDELILRGMAYGNVSAYGPAIDMQFRLRIGTQGDLHTIDLTLPSAPDDLVPTTYLGIYRLEGDDLTLCLNIPNRKRPGQFKTREQSMELLLKLRRDKTAEWEESPRPRLLERQPGDDRPAVPAGTTAG